MSFIERFEAYKAGNVRINVTLGRVRVTIVAVGKKYYIF